MKKLSLILLTVVALVASSAQADVRLPKILSSNMVLQQEMPVTVWGWADKGERVTVELTQVPTGDDAAHFRPMKSETVTAEFDDDGRWWVSFPARKADGKTYKMTVRGKNTIVLDNLVFGEVWLCAGQSNMNRGPAISETYPGLRLFFIAGSTVPRRDELDEAYGWMTADAESWDKIPKDSRGRTRNFTEVGLVFGQKIQKELDVPVGLIRSAFGGSQVKAWTPVPDFEKEYPYDVKVERSYVGHVPGLLYQSMVHGMIPLSIRGVVWYQGENDGRSRKLDYAEDMKRWIESWRSLWGRPDMPFYYVQISPTGYASGMQYVWRSQSWIMDNVPHTGMASTNDFWTLRDANPIKTDEATGWPTAGSSNPHPPNKDVMALRVADIAMKYTYGRADMPEVYGPMYDSHKVEGDRVLVKFKHAGSGLATYDEKSPNWFQLSDGTIENRKLKFVKAEAKIVSPDTVELRAPAIGTPTQIRYGWHAYCRINLINKEGLPAVPFKTDDE